MAPDAKLMDGYEAARAWLAGLGLPMPYIPVALRARMKARDEHTYTTREPLPTEPIWLQGWLEDVEESAPEDYAVIAYQGRGSNTWAIHTYIAVGPLVLLLQLAWGTAFGDADAQTRGVGQAFALLRPLIEEAERRSDEPRRLVFVASSFEDPRWRRLPDGEWQEGDCVAALRAELGLDQKGTQRPAP